MTTLLLRDLIQDFYCTVQTESRIGEERYGWNH